MRHLRCDVERAGFAFQRIHIFRKRFPAPLDAFRECAAGDVFDAFHKADEPVALARMSGREADPAIAHHGGRDAMPAGRRE